MTLEPKKNKQLLFLVAQPRSGNTLFASIMNQNPEIAATPNSITLEIMKDLFLLKNTDVFLNYPDHKSLDNVLDFKIYEEAREAYDAELRLIEWILDGYENEFLSYDILKTYLGIRMNDSLEKIGFEKMFDVDEDLAEKTLWMEEEIYVPALTDFFHKKPIDYQKAMKSFDAGELF